MRLLLCAGSAALLMVSLVPARSDPLTPTQIKTTFFNGEAFTAGTPQGIKYKMVFTPEGKVSREPVGKAGVKGDGTWKVSKDGFCTQWKDSKANCYQLISIDDKWQVMQGTRAIATWTKP